MYPIGEHWYAHPYMPETRVKLLPEGRIEGNGIVLKWEPITKLSRKLYKGEIIHGK
jgi:hypothetical protein